jgi:predicted RND superfamily exporter protein
MESFFRGVIRFRYLVILTLLGGTLFFGVQLKNLRFESDAESMIPPDDPVQRYNELVEERFGIRDLIIVGVLNDNPQEQGVFNPRTLRIVKEFSEKIALLPGIKAVRNEDVASVATMDNITGTADGIAVEPFMKEVPQTQEELSALKHSLFNNPMYMDWLVSRDGTGLLIMAKMESSKGTLEGVARRAAIYRTLREMIQAQKDAGAPEEFYIAGRGAMEVTFSEDARQDMGRFMPLVLVIVIGTLYLTYRSLRGVLLPLLVVVASVIWTLGIMAMVEVPMYFISTMMPVILLANGVAYGIHILSRYYDELLEQPGVSVTDAVLAALREMWSPVLFTALTTVAGFLSFLTAAMLPLRFFGLFTAVGIFVALIFSLTFLPAALAMLPPMLSRGGRRPPSRCEDLAATGWVARILTRIGRGVARHPLLVWAPTVILIGVCLAGIQRITVDSSWIRSFHPRSPVRIADEVLREKFQGTLPTYVTIEGHTPDLLKDPQLLEKLDRMQAEIEQDPSVGGSLSIAEFLKRMHRVMNEDRPEMEVVPPSRDLVSQYLLLYSFSGDPDDFDEVVDYDYRHANVAFYLRSDSTQDILRVVHKLQDYAEREFGRAAQDGSASESRQDPLSLRFGRWLGGVEPTITGWETNSGFRIGFAGPGYFTHRFSELVVAGQLSSLATSLVTVFVLTVLMFRSLTAGVINVIPIALVMIFGFGVMGLLDIPLEVGRSLTASMVIGSGIDYTIHFLNKYRVKVGAGLTDPREITVATMATAGKAIFLNALVVIGGYLVFLTSNFPPNFSLGAMVALNMSACLVAAVTVLPTMLNTCKPRFVFGRAQIPPSAIHLEPRTQAEKS